MRRLTTKNRDNRLSTFRLVNLPAALIMLFKSNLILSHRSQNRLDTSRLVSSSDFFHSPTRSRSFYALQYETSYDALRSESACSKSRKKVLRMSRKKVCSSISLQYHLDDNSTSPSKVSDISADISDLGVIVSTDLSWANHIEDICPRSIKPLV